MFREQRQTIEQIVFEHSAEIIENKVDRISLDAEVNEPIVTKCVSQRVTHLRKNMCPSTMQKSL